MVCIASSLYCWLFSRVLAVLRISVQLRCLMHLCFNLCSFAVFLYSFAVEVLCVLACFPGSSNRPTQTTQTRLTVHRRRQYLVELFGIDELEEFWRGAEVVPRRAFRHR
ncbi:unnamed protein product [Prorocentrum cordatum]|uniref:Secreted protein n=1 Tax=Prorocentrum cordatum TaxID=2364126 RepID=A0ABN9YCK0_9DINO|nr:unnamed protein product [Polarella glacialis]